MARTTVNVCGDLMVSVLVGKSENELDETVYNRLRPATNSSVQSSTV